MDFWLITCIISMVKLLLLPSYRSTDFEVHRNWLAITNSLPVSKWYYEKTSEWTLDYPPLFAWFEFGLSKIAYYFDTDMLKISKDAYASFETVLFQKLSVIFTDFIFIYAAKEYCKYSKSYSWRSSDRLLLVLSVLLVANVGLLLVDHIHFQYNGFLFGLLLMSITKISQGSHIQGALWFAVLLNFKHIYLYVAPVYFIYLLRNYCFSSNKKGGLDLRSFSIVRLLLLGVTVITVFAVSFGPFLYLNQIPQVLSRLFPFKRGLCHAYWAPNFWALYNVADKALAVLGARLGWVNVTDTAGMTGGLVQQFDHVVLPSIKPLTTFICTLISMLPALVKLWLYPTGSRGFVQALVLCAYGSFMFGWHVHEKAVLLIIIPLALLAIEKKKDAQVFAMLSTIGHFSLFPLIFTQAESVIKYILVLMYSLYVLWSLGFQFQDTGSTLRLPLLSHVESWYILGLIPLELYCNGLHYLTGLDAKLPFLPLLLTSVYCAVGVFYTWIKFYWLSLTETTIKDSKSD